MNKASIKIQKVVPVVWTRSSNAQGEAVLRIGNAVSNAFVLP